MRRRYYYVRSTLDFFFYAVHKPYTGESTRKCIGPGVRYEKKKKRTKKKNVKTNAFIVRTRCRLHTRAAGRARAQFTFERGKTVFFLLFFLQNQCLLTCGRPVPQKQGGPNCWPSQFTCPYVNTRRRAEGERQTKREFVVVRVSFYNKRIIDILLRYRSIHNHGDKVTHIVYRIWNLNTECSDWRGFSEINFLIRIVVVNLMPGSNDEMPFTVSRFH